MLIHVPITKPLICSSVPGLKLNIFLNRKSTLSVFFSMYDKSKIDKNIILSIQNIEKISLQDIM